MASHSMYSCLENARDRGAWWTATYGVAQSRTRLKRLSSSNSSSSCPLERCVWRFSLDIIGFDMLTFPLFLCWGYVWDVQGKGERWKGQWCLVPALRFPGPRGDRGALRLGDCSLHSTPSSISASPEASQSPPSCRAWDWVPLGGEAEWAPENPGASCSFVMFHLPWLIWHLNEPEGGVLPSSLLQMFQAKVFLAKSILTFW